MKDGKINGLKWKNGCVPRTCEFEDCHENKYKAVVGPHGNPDKEETEKNCFVRTCRGSNSRQSPNCDTKVYITWEGNDKENRYCVSDDFRITNLMQHSIQSYFDSAINVSPLIVKNGKEVENERQAAVEAAALGVADPCTPLADGQGRGKL